jgi:hypothetical protein
LYCVSILIEAFVHVPSRDKIILQRSSMIELINHMNHFWNNNRLKHNNNSIALTLSEIQNKNGLQHVKSIGARLLQILFRLFNYSIRNFNHKFYNLRSSVELNFSLFTMKAFIVHHFYSRGDVYEFSSLHTLFI